MYVLENEILPYILYLFFWDYIKKDVKELKSLLFVLFSALLIF